MMYIADKIEIYQYGKKVEEKPKTFSEYKTGGIGSTHTPYAGDVFAAALRKYFGSMGIHWSSVLEAVKACKIVEPHKAYNQVLYVKQVTNKLAEKFCISLSLKWTDYI